MTNATQVIQIRNKSLVLYDQIERSNYISYEAKWTNQTQLAGARKVAYNGNLSDGAKKRLAKAIDIMVQSIKPQKIFNPVTNKFFTHRLTFITLTIASQKNITAKEGYNEAFKHFLQWMRRTAKVTTYVWKAEFQKRGQLHYHITTPSFIHYQLIKDKWNNLQRQAGWLDDYEKQHGHYDPPSTDIGETRNIKNLSAYMIKEFIKSIQNQTTIGKVWDCSENLSKAKYFTIYETSEKMYIMEEYIQAEKTKMIELDRCIVLTDCKFSTTEIMNLDELKRYEDYLQIIRQHRSLKEKVATSNNLLQNKFLSINNN